MHDMVVWCTVCVPQEVWEGFKVVTAAYATGSMLWKAVLDVVGIQFLAFIGQFLNRGIPAEAPSLHLVHHTAGTLNFIVILCRQAEMKWIWRLREICICMVLVILYLPGTPSKWRNIINSLVCEKATLITCPCLSCIFCGVASLTLHSLTCMSNHFKDVRKTQQYSRLR